MVVLSVTFFGGLLLCRGKYANPEVKMAARSAPANAPSVALSAASTFLASGSIDSKVGSLGGQRSGEYQSTAGPVMLPRNVPICLYCP